MRPDSLVIIVLTLLFLGFGISIFLRHICQDSEESSGGSRKPGTKGPARSVRGEQLLAAAVFFLVLLAVLGGYFLFRFKSVAEGADTGLWSSGAFLPLIWIVLFIPVFIGRKRRRPPHEIQTLTLIALLGLGLALGVYFLFQEGGVAEKVTTVRSDSVLTRQTATELVHQAWGSCDEADCERLSVRVLDSGDGVGLIEAVYDGLHDDSVRTIRRRCWAHQTDGNWTLGAVVITEYRCQPGRGQQDFSKELCL
ncbi:hypothetical protein AMJ57_01935 [Parcubacteria bacterium SG8_24]|nr:MAG: hypothetical protein AMJ57_01935 [Parcubacteria bacterium SG8_24]